MEDTKKKYILIIIVIVINAFFIILAGTSVLKSIKSVFENGGVSSSITEESDEEEEVDKIENVDNEDIDKEDTIKVENLEPVVNVQSKLINEKPTFVIEIEDDNIIQTVEITHNQGEKQVIDVNEKTYYSEIEMKEGINTIIVTAIDDKGLEKTRRVKFENM